MIGDINWSVLFEGGGTITGTTSFDIDDVCWSRMFKPDGGGSEDDGGDKPFDELTWDQVIASTKTGKYKTFTVGAMKELDLGSEGVIHMQIAGIDVDDLADGSGKAPLTFISKELLNTNHTMNATGTTNGGWKSSAVREYLKDSIKPLIPAAIAAGIKEVTKYSRSINPSNNNDMTTDDVWIPSNREIFGDTSFETAGPIYNGLFNSTASRRKFKPEASGSDGWWLRSVRYSSSFCCVDSGGNRDYANASANVTRSVALGFCL